MTASGARTITDADGTFALQVSGARTVAISCPYCRTASARVVQGTVVAIVRRYDALLSAPPSIHDVAALPYAHAESDASLQPFTVLNDSSAILPGPRVSTYGASQFGGLLLDDGIPQYDIAAGASAWRVFPAFDQKRVDVRDQRDAFLYGDMAGGGTFSVDTRAQSGASALALGGDERALNVSRMVGPDAFGAAASSTAFENRLRADATASFPIGEDSVNVTALVAQDGLAPPGDGSSAESASGVRAHYQSVGPSRTYADLIADRSGYNVTTASGARVEGLWSDVSAEAGVATSTPVSLFAAVSARGSSGYYDASSLGVPRVAGTLAQTQATIGASRSSDRYAIQSGASVFSVAYSGGTLGISQPRSATILAPELSGSYRFSDAWSADVSLNEAFRLPSLLEAYGSGAPSNDLSFDRYDSVVASVAYTDAHRVRASLLAMSERVSNLDEGMVHSAGAQIAWQIAPTLSLRVWDMHVGDTTAPEYPLVRFARTAQPANVGSAWVTYDVPGGVRLDAIYRRDLLDYMPDAHFDASASGPLAGALRWFAASQRLHGNRFFSAGIRFETP